MIFWDTSSLVKAYFASETGHARARSLLLGGNPSVGSVLLWPEAAGALARRAGKDFRLRDSALGLLQEHLEDFDLLPVEEARIESAVRLLRKHSLGGIDALHLASALALVREVGRRPLRFVTSDAPQAAAARSEGLKVIEPA